MNGSLHTPLCDFFDIEYQILLAGMGGVSTAPLAAVVSNDGGLGVFGAADLDPDELCSQFDPARGFLTAAQGSGAISGVKASA